MAKLTPMMQQYVALKEEYADSILMFRLGDFYEMFFEDAKTASRELELVLTGRNCGMEERAPMCGIPHHAVDGYIARLIEKGYKVAICDQLEDPAAANGIVKRGVTRVVTPGTVVENSMLSETENSYILSLCMQEGGAGLCYCDVSTGEFCVLECADAQQLLNELIRINPKEIIAPDSSIKEVLKLQKSHQLRQAFVNPYFDWAYEEGGAREALTSHFKVKNLSAYGCGELDLAICAAGGLIQYLRDTQKNSLLHISRIVTVQDSEYMALDTTTIRNLELTQTIMTAKKRGSLLWLLDRTRTAPGARLLKKFVLQPLKTVDEINARLDAVAEIVDDIYLKNALSEHLRGIYDLERIMAKISYGTINARDCLSLRDSLNALPDIRALLSGAASSLLRGIYSDIDELEDVSALLLAAINEEPPVSITEGGIIKPGFEPEIDSLITASMNGRQWLAELQSREREATGIKNLKISYNKVFGYYIEVTKSYLSQVPYRYFRKQTLANCERFITDELKEMEEKILGAEEKKNRLEYETFTEIRDVLAKSMERIQKSAGAVALLDVLAAFAQAALENSYVRPTVSDNGIIELKESRHPVVEKMLGEGFVPNDVLLDMGKNNMLVITGPNMAGKSTYMRQTGLIVLMAHIGCFVPCAAARICLVDRLFTRVGASDDLAAGQSTFMVEMNELANILNNATENSLLILDEIGRGTSTIDGLSIAWASVEYIIKRLRAKTLFATHFHELVELENIYPEIHNCSVAVKEIGQEIIFLHKLVDGGTDRSFGIEVARLAGLPKEVIKSSRKQLARLQQNEFSLTATSAAPESKKAVPAGVRALLKTNVDELSPIEALNMIYSLRAELEEEYADEQN